MKKFIKFLKNNWIGALIGGVLGFSLLSLPTNFQILAMPGALISAFLSKIFNPDSGLGGAAMFLLGSIAINIVLYGLLGAYIESKVMK